MTLFLGILFVLAASGAILGGAMRAHASALSHYELDRRARQGDSRAATALQRQLLAADVSGIIQAKRLALLVASFGLAIGAFGWGWAVLLAVGLIVLQPALGRAPLVERLGRRLYDWYESVVLRFLVQFPWVGVTLRPNRPHHTQLQAGSKEELAHIIDQAGAHLTHEQQSLLLHSLQFDEHTVAEVMTAKSDTAVIDRHELLGPLVLDDLHKTGHSFFPVTNGSVDHVIGILSIDGFLSLDSKRSITAEKAMIPHVERIHADTPLRTALKRFLTTHQHLLIVEDETGAIAGVVTLTDVVGMLFGR